VPWFEYETCCLRSIVGYIRQIDRIDREGNASLMANPPKLRTWLMDTAGRMLVAMEEAREKSNRGDRPRRLAYALLIDIVYDRLERGKRRKRP
jgi:hypothetical protein